MSSRFIKYEPLPLKILKEHQNENNNAFDKNADYNHVDDIDLSGKLFHYIMSSTQSWGLSALKSCMHCKLHEL
jgi:hypothetical protein